MADRIEWAVRATETGTDLLTGTATPTAGTGTRAAAATINIPSTVLDGAGYGIRWRGVDNAENAETWKWRAFTLAAATTPFTGQALFVDPQAVITTGSAGEAAGYRKDMISRITSNPVPYWIGDWNMEPQAAVDAYMDRAQAAGRMGVIVVYGIPFKDLGQDSAGGMTEAQYPGWVDKVVAGIGGRKCAVIIEPDALAQLTDNINGTTLTAQQRTTRLSLLSQAMSKLSASSLTAAYLDAGHSSYVAAATMAQRLKDAGVAGGRGFALNVSNFKTAAAEQAYGKTVSDAIGGTTPARFVVDTSRNGLGPLPATKPDGSAWGRENWNNPPGRGLGSPSLTETPTEALCDAFLWIKTPGASDGTRQGTGETAPSAGTYYPAYAEALAENAPWASNPAAASVTASFASDADLTIFKSRATGVTRDAASGRLALAASTAYPAAQLKVFDLRGSSFHATVTPLPRSGSYQTIMKVEHNSFGGSIAGGLDYVQVMTNGANLVVRGYSGGAQIGSDTVVGAYSATDHARWRIRGAGQVVYVDTSPVGGAWTQRAAITVPWHLNGLIGSFVAGHYSAEAAATAYVDDLNANATADTTAPTTTQTAPAAGATTQRSVTAGGAYTDA